MEFVIIGCITLVICAMISYIIGILCHICGISVVHESGSKFLYYINNGFTIAGIILVFVAVISASLYTIGMTVSLLINH